MGNFDIKKTGYQFITMLLVGLIILVGQQLGLGIPFNKAYLGMIMLILVAQTSFIVNDLFPKSIFPAFGWATILGLLFSMPYNPLSKVFLSNVENINFMAITTPLLAFAGISVGNKIDDLKKMSWKIILIAMFIFTAIFFACASIAHIVLKLQGKI
ncbi:hypothetical protein KQI86_04780 [Clostridium sp. MSJ-11]|uniref:DUF340 domain-containing protein n=1 Tax=Clostridium mobile TaxID=2841512 RepID=A0ABS6EEJ2_9CLOT|nr:hypothetical protein [Clostridium mobile]MBU5483634.1 hypothetical protein [Clostridium mobile]